MHLSQCLAHKEIVNGGHYHYILEDSDFLTYAFSAVVFLQKFTTEFLRALVLGWTENNNQPNYPQHDAFHQFWEKFRQFQQPVL